MDSQDLFNIYWPTLHELLGLWELKTNNSYETLLCPELKTDAEKYYEKKFRSNSYFQKLFEVWKKRKSKLCDSYEF